MPNKELSPSDLDNMFSRMSKRRATRYAYKLIGNKDSPAANVELVMQYIESHPDRFMTDDEIRADPNFFKDSPKRRRGRQYRQGNGQSGKEYPGFRTAYDIWRNGYPNQKNGNQRRKPSASAWRRFRKSQDEFDAMSPKEKKFFVRAYRNRDPSRNAPLFLRILTSKSSSKEDKAAALKVVEDNPGMFYKRGKKNPNSRN